jgi:hypothetical protein
MIQATHLGLDRTGAKQLGDRQTPPKVAEARDIIRRRLNRSGSRTVADAAREIGWRVTDNG